MIRPMIATLLLADAAVAATGLDPASLRSWLETSVTMTVLGLLILGILIPAKVVKEQIAAPLQERNHALEEAVRKRDEENAAMVRQMAAALESNSNLLEQVLRQLITAKGGGD